MANGNLYDEARVRAMPDGGELVLGKRDLATPAALDVAFAKGIRVRWTSDGGAPKPTGSPGAPTAAGGALARMLTADGTYVVEVKGGRAVVHRLTPSGPVPIREA